MQIVKEVNQLDAREKRFVDEYLIDLDPQRAALESGYSKSVARSSAYTWVSDANKKPHVYRAIQESMQRRSERTHITQDRVLEELAKIGFANMTDYIRVGGDGDAYVDLSTLDRDKAAAISEITVEDFKDGRGEDARDIRRVKFKLLDKRAALVDIGKHLGMFSSKIELTGKNGGPVQHQNVGPNYDGFDDIFDNRGKPS